MDDKLKALLESAKSNGASDDDLRQIIKLYEADALKKKMELLHPLQNKIKTLLHRIQKHRRSKSLWVAQFQKERRLVIL